MAARRSVSFVFACVGAALVAGVVEARGQAYAGPGPRTVGWQDIVAPNPLAGTPQLRLRLHYPALLAGEGTPVDVAHGPYPLVLFGHGLGNGPQPYAELLNQFASWGLFVVAPDTATWGPQALLAQDLAGSLAAINALAAPGQPLDGVLLPGVSAVAGHSMGAGAAVIAASLAPDVDAVLALSPWNAPADISGVPTPVQAASSVHAPLSIIVGALDTIAPPPVNAQPIYAAATAVARLRLISIVAGAGHNDPLLFDQARNDGVAFLLAYLADAAAALDEVYGPAAQADLQTLLQYEVRSPDCFMTGVAAPSKVIGLNMAGPVPSALLCLMSGTKAGGLHSLPGLQLPAASLFVVLQGAAPASQVLSLKVALPANILQLPQLQWYMQSADVLPGGDVQFSPLRTITLALAP